MINTKFKTTIIPLTLVLLLCSIFTTRAQVIFDIGENGGTQNIALDVTVTNYNEIISQQFSILWDDNIAVLDSVGNFNLPDLSAFNFNSSQNGQLTHSWFDNTFSGISLPDNSVIFTLYFSLLSDSGTAVFFSNNPVITEIVNLGGIIDFPSMLDGYIIGENGVSLSGIIYHDEDEDCNYSVGNDATLSRIVRLTDGNNTFYTASDNTEGTYSIFLEPGNYTVDIINPNQLWEACQASYFIEMPDNSQTYTLDIGSFAIRDCYAMSVNIGTPFLRRCFDNNYSVSYCNDGNIAATDAYINIEPEEFLLLQGASVPYTDNGDYFTFDIGTVEPGECGHFVITLIPECENTVLDQTMCVVANIFPNDLCLPEGESWDGPTLQVEGNCDGEQINFTIENIGTGDMTEPSQYIVIEDNIMYMETPFTLNSGASILLPPIEANGSTFRLQAMQVEGHPGSSMPTLAIEGCGTNNSGTFSTGFVNQFPQDNGDSFRAVSCEQIIGSFDPNDKQGFPLGFGPENGIKADTDIDYKIRFQNTGTDTAFTVVIKDQILEGLDPATVRPGASSHPYEFEIFEAGEMIFTFNNIMLPDSNINEPASHGFVNFRISQEPGLPAGTTLHNSAAIYFDFNDPVITNTTVHTIVEDLLGTNTYVAEDKNITLKSYPNPFHDFCDFEISGMEGEALTFQLYRIDGRLVKEAVFQNGQYRLHKTGLATGNYFYQVVNNNEIVAAGKLVAQ